MCRLKILFVKCLGTRRPMDLSLHCGGRSWPPSSTRVCTLMGFCTPSSCQPILGCSCQRVCFVTSQGLWGSRSCIFSAFHRTPSPKLGLSRCSKYVLIELTNPTFPMHFCQVGTDLTLHSLQRTLSCDYYFSSICEPQRKNHCWSRSSVWEAFIVKYPCVSCHSLIWYYYLMALKALWIGARMRGHLVLYYDIQDFWKTKPDISGNISSILSFLKLWKVDNLPLSSQCLAYIGILTNVSNRTIEMTVCDVFEQHFVTSIY